MLLDATVADEFKRAHGLHALTPNCPSTREMAAGPCRRSRWQIQWPGMALSQDGFDTETGPREENGRTRLHRNSPTCSSMTLLPSSQVNALGPHGRDPIGPGRLPLTTVIGLFTSRRNPRRSGRGEYNPLPPSSTSSQTRTPPTRILTMPRVGDRAIRSFEAISQRIIILSLIKGREQFMVHCRRSKLFSPIDH